MKKSFLYLILICIATSSIIVGTVYASLGIAAAPGTNLPGQTTLYAVKVNPANTDTIAHIVVNFAGGGYTITGARVFHVQNIGAGHLSFPNSTAISYDVITPVSVPAGTQVDLLLGNITNTNTAGLGNVGFDINSTSAILESGIIQLTIQNTLTPDITDSGGKIGINNPSLGSTLDVGGDIGVSGNIIPDNGNPICIGVGC